MFQPSRYIHAVDICNRQKEVPLDLFLPLVPKIVAATLAVEKTSAAYIGVTFLSDRSMRRYHDLYFHDPSPTDCMSFPIDGRDEWGTENGCLGDIFLCPKVALSFAKKEQISFEKELSLYIVHATLHLLGYDDIKDDERHIMRQKEEEIMKFLENI